MKKRGSLPTLVAATLTVALVCTLAVDGGWMIWVPVLPALVVTGILVRWIG